MVPPRKPDSWDSIFMAMARDIARRSKDPNTQIGAVVVDRRNVIVSCGFNGPPRGIDDSAIDWARPNKYAWILHAEDNALYFGGHRCIGCRMYVLGIPCPRCALLIVRAGIREVVYDASVSVQLCDTESQILTKQILARGRVNLTEFRT